MSLATDYLCIASGPSLTAEDVAIVKAWRAADDSRRVIAVNNCYQIAPWSDTIYGCDGQWWRHYYKDVEAISGAEFVAYSREANMLFPRVATAEKLGAGSNSGYQAIMLAANRGATTIRLLGYDYQHTGGRIHFHQDHPHPLTNIKKFKVEEMEALSIDLGRRGIQIVNYTRDTALKCFQRLSIEALGL